MSKLNIVSGLISMWPREVMDIREDGRKGIWLKRDVAELRKSGVYVLYRDEEPYYIGRATRLWSRIHAHANMSSDRYFNFWNFFSAFVTDERHINEVEAILIAAMPTANSSTPRVPKIVIPPRIVNKLRQIRRHETDPVTQEDFRSLQKEIKRLVGPRNARSVRKRKKG